MPERQSSTKPVLESPVAPARRIPRNRRLQAHERQEQILDAALYEFSRQGYGAARMDDIAARAGLSKGGLYAHFPGKAALFEALMQRMMQPDLLFEEQSLNQSSFRGGQSPQALAVLIDDFLDRAYARLRDDRFIRTLHLLISEGPRANDLLEAWRRRHLELLQQQQGALHLAVDQGKLRDSALTDMVQLIHAPILLGAVLVMLQDEKHANDVLPRLRSAHRRLLLEMLPRETDSA